MRLGLPVVLRRTSRSAPALLCAATAFVVCLLMSPAAAFAAYTFGSEVTEIGPTQPVLDHATNDGDPQHCNDLFFIQDAPSRAFRDPSGTVQLIISHAGTPQAPQGHTRRLTASNLTNLPVTSRLLPSDPRCAVIHSSENDPEPDQFNNWEWMVSPYTEDGQNIYTLVHNEYHGWEFSPSRCPSSNFTLECWYNQITLAKSTNRGALYTRAAAPNHLIASIPYQYSSAVVPGGSGAKGYFQPGNIVKRGSLYYTLFRAEKYQQQPTGTCAMRTDNLNDPLSWRAWGDGDANPNTPDDYDVQMVDPYLNEPPDADKPKHMCKPIDTQFADPPTEVSPNGVSRMASHLVWSRYFKKFMVIDADKRNVNGQSTTGVYYSLSKDLINWDPVKLLMKAPLAWDRPCPSADRGIRVPALLDPNSTDRNFNTVGQTADLYFVESRFDDNPPNCVETLDRDLVRIPIRFTAKPEGDRLATLEGPAIIDPSTGFDSKPNVAGFILQDTSYHYDGVKAAWLRSSPTSSGPWGGFTTSAPGVTGWPNGTDVWYGAAFRLDLGFKVKVPRVMLMRWLNSNSDNSPPPTRYGGILMKPDDSFQLVRGGTGVTEEGIGASFSLPEGRWFWLEVHQKLESDATKGPLSEVFVDGKPVAKSGALNAYPDSDGVPINAHFGYAQRTSGGSTTDMRLDRASTSTMQRGPLGAPATPTGLTGSDGMSSITLTWNASSDLAGGGYRVYKQNLVDGTWDQVQQSSSPGYTEMPLVPCSRPHYRVSAYSGSAIGEESPQSEEIEMRPQPGMGCP